MPFTLYLDIITILSIGLMIGVEFAVSAFINPTLRKLDPAPQAKSLSLFASVFGKVMPFWYGLNLLFLLCETFFRYGSGGFSLLIAASSLLALIIIVTIAVLVPLNNRVAKFQTTTLPSDWQQIHRRWDNLHRLRVLLLIVAYVLAIYAILITR